MIRSFGLSLGHLPGLMRHSKRLDNLLSEQGQLQVAGRMPTLSLQLAAGLDGWSDALQRPLVTQLVARHCV